LERLFKIATAAIVNSNQEVLLVRKRETSAFMLPSGKIESGETALRALARELGEELNADLTSNSFDDLGIFQDMAANETGYQVKANVFVTCFDGGVEPLAEIEELRWIEPGSMENTKLAPLLRNHVLPALNAYLAPKGGIQ
jgi:8-oxo-dGTP diphosphatase